LLIAVAFIQAVQTFTLQPPAKSTDVITAYERQLGITANGKRRTGYAL